MDLNLHHKVAIVTGGNKGFGGASARLLAREGAKRQMPHFWPPTQDSLKWSVQRGSS